MTIDQTLQTIKLQVTTVIIVGLPDKRMQNSKILVLAVLATLIANCTAFPQDGKPSAESSCLEKRAQEEKNKELAITAFQAVIGDHDIEAADKYFHPNVTEHNPKEQDGLESFKKFATLVTKNREKGKVDFKRVAADGDLVWAHVRIPDVEGKDLAIIHIFRIENDLIVEHWDVTQTVPEAGESKNPHPLF